jgi:hypothetical protein
MKRLREQCEARYDAWRAREAAEKKRREEQERAEKEAAKQAARTAGVFGRQVPQGISSGVRAAMGVTGGAWPLSEALTRGGAAGVNGIQKRVLEQLIGEMDGVNIDESDRKGRYSAANPRRSQSQFDRALSILDEPQRVEALDNNLPFGGHSVVTGAYASIVTQLVEAQAQGHIDTPLAAIGIAVATWVAWEAGQAELQMKDKQRQRLQAAALDMLPRQRKVARQTMAAMEPVTPTQPDPDPIPEPDSAQNPTLDVSGHGGENLDASYCVSVKRDGSFADITNNCPFVAFYRCNDGDHPERDKIRVGQSLTVYGCPYLSWGFRKQSFFETSSSDAAVDPEPENAPCALRHQGREISAYECSGIQ